jgi:Fe-S-cluster containining protein
VPENPTTRSVPCGSCQHCCRHEYVAVDPAEGDIVELYETIDVINPFTQQPQKALARKPNGDCLYLGAAGCTIHGRHPAACRRFDCRLVYLGLKKMPRVERRLQIREHHDMDALYEIGGRMQRAYPLD